MAAKFGVVPSLKLLCVAAAAVTCASARADSVTLGASKDVTLYSEADNGANGSGTHIFAGRINGDPVRRAIVHFNVSGIPAGSTISSVTLTLYMSRTQAGNQNVQMHRVLADWGEGASVAEGQEGAPIDAQLNDATWKYRFFNPADPPSSPAWATPGGDYISTASATSVIGSSNGYYSWTSAQLAADVSSWVNGTNSNFGWILIGNETTAQTAKRFDSRTISNASRRPALTIVYTPPTLTGACCLPGDVCQVLTSTQCASQGGTFQGNGTSCTPNPCGQPTGACCLADGECQILTSAQCASQSGIYQGDGSTCTPNPCPQPTGACCFNSGTCAVLTLTDCLAQGGTYLGAGVPCTSQLCPVVLTPFVDALPIPPVAVPTSGVPGGSATYDIEIVQVQQQLHSQLPPTTVWAYDGLYPGPTILATRDVPITVNWINDLRDGSGNFLTSHYLTVDPCPHGAVDLPRVVTHLHGGHVPPEADGYPENTFLPGQSATYVYPNNQVPSLVWYHDHALGMTRLNVYMGLAGGYLITDEFEQTLTLPAGEYDIPLIVQDRMFNPDGSLHYPAMWHEHFFGDKMLVNGKVWPYLNVKRGKYRFRLLNGCNSRTLTLALSNAQTFQQLGTDGGLLEAPVPMNQLTIGPGERADIIIDFAGLAAGTEVLLINSAPAPYPNGDLANQLPNVMKFIVQEQTGFTAPVPTFLRPLEVLNPATSVAERDLSLQKFSDPCTGSIWLINGMHWDHIDEYPRLDTTEIWSFINRSGISHPMHMHLVFFQVLDRQDFEIIDGEVVPVGPVIPAPANEVGWKDTVMAHPNQITRVIARFEDYTGRYPYHCHILEHEDHEMMRQFEVLAACPADVNNDNSVNVADLLAVISAWGACGDPANCPEDVNDDGNVNVADLLAVIGSWGPCP